MVPLGTIVIDKPQRPSTALDKSAEATESGMDLDILFPGEDVVSASFPPALPPSLLEPLFKLRISLTEAVKVTGRFCPAACTVPVPFGIVRTRLACKLLPTDFT